jgi:hypothetical protein
MNLFSTFRGLVRRWYITIPGLILAVVAAVGVWQMTPPDYQRSASQLLLPGTGVLPDGSTNRFLFMGGLAPVADVLARAMTSDEGLREIYENYPGTEVEIARDPSTSGPVVRILVTAQDDEQVGVILDELVALSATTLDRLQTEESIPSGDRVTVRTISIDEQSTVRERDRVVMSAAAGLGVLLLTVVLASLVDGLASRAGRRRDADGQSEDDSEVSAEESEEGGEAPEAADAVPVTTPDGPVPGHPGSDAAADRSSDALPRPVASAPARERPVPRAATSDVDEVVPRHSPRKKTSAPSKAVK